MQRVNLGCGATPLPGDVNIDFQSYACWTPEQQATVRLHDVTVGLPFADGSVAEVRGDQFLEHLTLSQIVSLLDECLRVLCPLGEVRFEFPDIGACSAGPLDSHFVADVGAVLPGVPEDLVMLNLLTHEWGHQCILTLPRLLPVFTARFAILHAATYGTNSVVLARKRG